MALTKIEYGSLASSEIMNQNFLHLDNRISNLSEKSISNLASTNSNIASINSTINSSNDHNSKEFSNIKSDIEKIKSILSTNGDYTTTYRNGNSWYIEHYSDEEKKNRKYVEQGGICNSNSSTTYLKPFSNNSYSLILGTHCVNFEGGGINSKTPTGFSHRNGKGWSYSVEWYAFGE